MGAVIFLMKRKQEQIAEGFLLACIDRAISHDDLFHHHINFTENYF